MKTTPPRMSYWLVPAEPLLSKLQEVVSRYAIQLNGPDFEPHATIYFGLYNVSDSVEEILNRLEVFNQ